MGTKDSTLFLLAALFLVFFRSGYATDLPDTLIDVSVLHEHSLGKHFSYLKEQPQAELSLRQASSLLARLSPNEASRIETDVVSFGVGSAPVWLRATFTNPQAMTIERNLYLKNIWIDNIDVYFLTSGDLKQKLALGDSLKFKQRPVDSRFFIIPYAFPPGETEVYIRVETEDPVSLPIYVYTESQMRADTEFDFLSYGFLYGAVLSLLIYNLMIFLSLKDTRYLYYSVFLSCFLVMNISYTGHGYRWLWPDNPSWQMWCGSTTVLIYNLSALLFVRDFLNLKARLPLINRSIILLSYVSLFLFVIAFLCKSNLIALIIAMLLTLTYPLISISLGVTALVKGYQAAVYFFLGSLFAALGMMITSLSLWGVIPFSLFSFRAVELGIWVDIVLLSLALAETVKESKNQRVLAENTAMLDPLTNLYNRRGLETRLAHSTLKNTSLAAILLDIDYFKMVNDAHGHQFGDIVLKTVAGVIKDNARHKDIPVRWGGEELLILLIDTSIEDAAKMAERIRAQIATTPFQLGSQTINVTASFGVAACHDNTSISKLIESADKSLYAAKNSGRNNVQINQN